MSEKERLQLLCTKAWKSLQSAKELFGEESEAFKYCRTKWYTLDEAYTLVFGETLHYYR